jgi:hypothetical protein
MDKFPWLAAETGTMGTTTVSLTGVAISFAPYPSRTIAAAAEDVNTDFNSGDGITALITKDASNWRLYRSLVWTDASPDTLNLATATLVATAGTIDEADAVSVIAVTTPDFGYAQLEVAVPSTPTSTGVKGNWAYDATTGYFYHWVATDTVCRYVTERTW